MLDLLDALLAPFARLMVALGVPFADLAERLKAHYVEAARKACDGKPTDSRLSVMTGLQRRDIARLRDFHPNEPRLTHLSRLVSLWQTEDEYAGKPLTKSGPTPSFEALAWEVRRDVHPRTMLDTLLAAGTVAVEGETVTLLESSYQPLAGSEDQMAYLARNMGDHLSAATTNITSDTPPFFERAVHYAALAPDQVQALELSFREGQAKLLEQLNKDAAAMKALPSEVAPVRFRAGGYFYHEDST
ncbi:DUF6502 family protein [Litoreibacter janthinus]|nr:DUF6502 family protein [Litoreibacter janthinus]